MDDPRVKMQEALKQAMLKKDALTRDVLRMTLSAMKQVEVDERRDLTPDDALQVLQREVKKRRESIQEARNVGREDIATQEERELTVIDGFLPSQLSREQIEALAREAIQQSGAVSAKEMGKVMSVLMPKVKGVADGKLVNEVVRELLSNA
ncbi:MAG: GatB/YqeY domain-containing protein [Anaerolineae bacterium]|nr:GatB/YqeY domain-containing protein [Anaerolineae bacterium]NUQ03586.1 GatB/YqeY domain-containing protein [Anaerolineae bacterium]